VHLGGYQLHEPIECLVLVPHVVVERGGLDAELLGELAHAQRLDAAAVGESAVLELRAGADQGDQMGCVARAPAVLADSKSLNAIATPAAKPNAGAPSTQQGSSQIGRIHGDPTPG